MELAVAEREVGMRQREENAGESEDREVLASTRTDPFASDADNNLDRHLYEDLGQDLAPDDNEASDEDNDQESVDEKSKATSPASEGNQEYEEVNGVKFTRDEHGNYCLPDGTPVYDAKKVPFRNRVIELTRRMEDAAKQEPSVQQQATPQRPAQEDEQFDDDEIDERWNMTYGQKRSITADFNAALQEVLNPISRQLATLHAKEQMAVLKENPKYKGFFENQQYVSELQEQLGKMTPQALYQENMIADAVDYIRGKHVEEILASKEKSVKDKVTQQRKIVGEVQVGSPAASETKSSSPVTAEAREYAALSKISPEAAQRILERRKAMAKKNK
jgi:hypothetical protein